ncbi:transmembrane protein FAM155A [Colossoma macropomum]|uniref:transmembrane protein FAM155A n=1 Tax=Colossoma macropomum TaxID=42526 RepID=UPI0018656850|nr:transmembrane protein FAM155A [Colossoma macropomum]
MTSGARTCRQQDDDDDDGLKTWWWCAPREDPIKPAFSDSERAHRWRLSLACLLLFLAVLLSDRLWLRAEAALARAGSGSSALLSAGASRQPVRPLASCRPDSVSKRCFAAEEDAAAAVCSGLSGAEWNLSDLYLAFCDSYSLLDLFHGLRAPPNASSCGLAMAQGSDDGHGDGYGAEGCVRCVRAYQHLDRQAREAYDEFELLVRKYETDAYSVRTCMDECTTVYKHWLCSQYFQTTQMHCSNRIPCRQYCLEVQQRCPFILPDNDELIYGGSPSFICTGLLEDNPSDAEAECCDVRWDSKPDNSSKGTLKRTHPSCQHGTSLTSSAASRLCNSRLKLCLLVLVLLHTVATITASHNLTTISSLEENSTNEEG